MTKTLLTLALLLPLAGMAQNYHSAKHPDRPPMPCKQDGLDTFIGNDRRVYIEDRDVVEVPEPTPAKPTEGEIAAANDAAKPKVLLTPPTHTYHINTNFFAIHPELIQSMRENVAERNPVLGVSPEAQGRNLKYQIDANAALDYCEQIAPDAASHPERYPINPNMTEEK